MEIGAQFFTLRDYCKTLPDFAETLKKVADIGYKTVQVSGVCPYEPEWLATELKKNDLRCVLTHTNVAADPLQTAKNHDVFDCKYAGLGYHGFDGTWETYNAFINTYTPVAQILKDNGKYFMYHNHASEFQKVAGKLVMDRIAEDFSPEELGFILDTYWIQKAGGDPAAWIEKFGGRLPVIHLKDYAFGALMAVVGEGNINFDRVFEKAESAGVQYMMVEQDNCNGEDPFECLRRSYEYLKSCGFN